MGRAGTVSARAHGVCIKSQGRPSLLLPCCRRPLPLSPTEPPHADCREMQPLAHLCVVYDNPLQTLATVSDVSASSGRHAKSPSFPGCVDAAIARLRDHLLLRLGMQQEGAPSLCTPAQTAARLLGANAQIGRDNRPYAAEMACSIWPSSCSLRRQETQRDLPWA